MEEHKEGVGVPKKGAEGTSAGAENVVVQPYKPVPPPSSATTSATIHPSSAAATSASTSAAISHTSSASSDAAKVKQLQAMMQQAREGYQALNQRYSAVQSECRQLMKKEEDSAATIQRLTAQVHRLSAAAAVAVNSASGLTATSGSEADEEKSELDMDKGRRGSDVDIAAQLREQAMVDRMQQLSFDLNNQKKEMEDWKQKCKEAQQQAALLKQQQQPQRASEEVDTLRHQVKQLTLDAAAIDSLALDLSVSQNEREKAERERYVLRDEVQRLLAKLEEAADEREREQAVHQHKYLTLRQRAEESDALATQNAHFSEELSLLTASITQLRDQLVATQRDNRALREEAERERTEKAEAENKLKRYGSDTEGGQLVDRRLVVKMLTTYYERGQAQDVLDVMCKVLQFTDDERQRVMDSRRSRGWVGSVASMLNPFDSERDSVVQRDDASVADLWAEFLLKETSREDNTPTGSTTPGKAIYEAMASPTAANGILKSATGRFSTPQPQRQSTPITIAQAPASSTSSAHPSTTVSPPPSQPSALSQPAHTPAAAPAKTHHTQSLPVPASHSSPLRPPTHLKATPITLPPHIRPAFPLPARAFPAPPSSIGLPVSFPSSAHSPLPSHPLFSAGLPLPRAALPGQPIPVARPASPAPQSQ